MADATTNAGPILNSQRKPLVRWAGSKRPILEHLVRAAPAGISTYVEPFGGSLSLFLRLNPTQAYLGDLNDELIRCYRQVRRSPQGVAAALATWKPDKATYLKLRALVPTSLKPTRRAARLLFLNTHCFNGLYRTNRSGQFNVPYSGVRTGPTPTLDRIRDFANVLSGHVLVSGDFEKTLEVAPLQNAFVYLDPPYVATGRRTFGEYQAKTFAATDLARLLSALHAIDSVGAQFMLSYAYSPTLARIFGGWNLKRLKAPRYVGGFGTRRGFASEMLVTNY